MSKDHPETATVVKLSEELTLTLLLALDAFLASRKEVGDRLMAPAIATALGRAYGVTLSRLIADPAKKNILRLIFLESMAAGQHESLTADSPAIN